MLCTSLLCGKQEVKELEFGAQNEWKTLSRTSYILGPIEGSDLSYLSKEGTLVGSFIQQIKPESPQSHQESQIHYHK